MIREMEFRVDIINNKENRLSATRINEVISPLRINDKFLIGDTRYIITYVKDKVKYISIKPIAVGY